MQLTTDLIKGRTILLIDSDRRFAHSLAANLSQRDAKILIAHEGGSGLKKLYKYHPHLVIMDIRSPGPDSLEMLRIIRMLTDTPIIILSDTPDEKDAVLVLQQGADDYIVKETSSDVLIARVEAVLRLVGRGNRKQTTLTEDGFVTIDSSLGIHINDSQKCDNPAYHDSYLSINLETRNVVVDDRRVRLTATEYRLLTYLLEHAGIPIDHATIFAACWGYLDEDNFASLHVYMSRLRSKLEKNPKKPVYLVTEYGYGYSFRKQTPSAQQAVIQPLPNLYMQPHN